MIGEGQGMTTLRLSSSPMNWSASKLTRRSAMQVRRFFAGVFHLGASICPGSKQFAFAYDFED
jgi:hypothetical protein